MQEHFNLYNGKFEAMLDNYLKSDVNIKPLVLLLLNIFINALNIKQGYHPVNTGNRGKIIFKPYCA